MKIPEKPPHDTIGPLQGATDRDAFWREYERGPAPEGRYRHWDTIRRIAPPEGLALEEVWAIRKTARRILYRPLFALLDRDGRPFQYALVDPVLERLHRVDRDAAGHIALPEQATNPATRDRYVVRSLIEEAITSSQLEGAATTRQVAKEMIRTGRAPRDRSEQMVLNNYRAMQHLRERLDESLTAALVTELHGIVTEHTLEAGSGPFRTPGDGVGVYDDQDQLLHSPPPADQIGERLERMCEFANTAETGVFLHPVVKSIILHFWLAYDHPFKDGNGRTARALFYWSMLKEGFWLAEYLSISSVLKRAPARYAKSFLYTETDDNDLTYFILAQLRVIEHAIAALKEYLARKVQEVAETKALLKPSSGLNHRQIALLDHATRHTGAAYTFESHGTSHDVAYATARADLLGLAEKGLVDQQKQGRQFVFVAPADLPERIKRL